MADAFCLSCMYAHGILSEILVETSVVMQQQACVCMCKAMAITVQEPFNPCAWFSLLAECPYCSHADDSVSCCTDPLTHIQMH